MSLSQDGVINNIGSARIAKEIIQLSLKACKIYGNWFQDVFGWKGKLPSRILLERHKNWVHFIQPIFCRPSSVGRVLQSIILSYINKDHLLSQHPHYRHAEITGRAPHTRETCQGWDGLIKKPLISIQLNGFTFIVLTPHWYNRTIEHWPGCVQHVNELYFQIITALPGPGAKKRPIHLSDNNRLGIPGHCLGDPGSCAALQNSLETISFRQI